MKKISFSIIIIGILAAGCSQKAQIETGASVGKSNSNETDEVAIFSKAVSDSIKQLGIVDIINPQYTFSLGKESYFLWNTEGNGTIMNTKDTHTIYSLASNSIKEVHVK